MSRRGRGGEGERNKRRREERKEVRTQWKQRGKRRRKGECGGEKQQEDENVARGLKEQEGEEQ